MSATTTDELSLSEMFLIERFNAANGIGEHRFAVSLPRLRDDDDFFEFCQRNDLLRIERDAEGNIEIMAPAGTDTGYHNVALIFELELWNRQQGRPGYAFDSNTGFTLPTGADAEPQCFICLTESS